MPVVIRVAVPWVGWVSEATPIGPPSMSVSLARTLTMTLVSSSVVALSSTATGASSTAVTVIETVAVEPPLRVYVKLSAPL